MKVALVIPIYNRPEYVSECFASLEKLTVKPDWIFIIDDCSKVEIPTPTFKNYSLFKTDKNSGVKFCLQTVIDHAFKLKYDLVINLDSDAVVKPDFVEQLLRLHKVTGLICSGFNNPKEPAIYAKGVLAHKAHANGINMCFNREQYEKHIKPALISKVGNWDTLASKSAGKVAITIPSCVQHIGMISSMGHHKYGAADRAADFKRMELKDVTLFGIDSHDIAGITRAAEISQRDITFGAVNIITKDLFTKGGTNEQRREDYSMFMMKELTQHFKTSHVLTIHADGYVLNWKAWRDEWLQYDYIGATWWYKDNMNVGNGGFSLRSKKLCDILATHDLGGGHYHPEDHHICRTYRPALESLGIKFAPEEVANNFSIEGYGIAPKPGNQYSGQFGFHSIHPDLSSLPVDIQYKKDVTNVQNNRTNVKSVVHLRR